MKIKINFSKYCLSVNFKPREQKKLHSFEAVSWGQYLLVTLLCIKHHIELYIRIM